MDNSRKVKLTSGAELVVTLSPFRTAKELYQACAEELQSLKLQKMSVESLSLSTEVDIGMLKDLLCAGLASKKIEAALAECMKRCLYNNGRINDDTFEPEDARQDYIPVCFEVAKANIAPFMKSLTQQFAPFLDRAKSSSPT